MNKKQLEREHKTKINQKIKESRNEIKRKVKLNARRIKLEIIFYHPKNIIYKF